MFMDITHYKSKRKGKRGPIPKDVPREASGRASRSEVELVHMVYFVALDGTQRLKVGRTQNIAQRLAQYRHGSGCEARCLAQLLVADPAESATLERIAIAYLRTRYERAGREWFSMPEKHLSLAISEIIAASGLTVELRGCPGTGEAQPSSFDYARRSAVIGALQYQDRRSHIR